MLPEDGVAVVMYGDCPLIRATTLTHLLDAHGAGRHATVLTAHAADPSGYGRMVRDAAGHPTAIIEHKECTPEELAITEVNVGLYAFDIAWLRAALPTLQPHSHKGEVYLTDLVELAAAAGSLAVLVHPDLDEMMGVNDKWSLCTARRLLHQRTLRAHAEAGVTFESPDSTVVEIDVSIGQDTVVEAGVVLRGTTTIGAGSQIGAHSVIIDSTVSDGALIKPHSMLEQATVATGATVGPYARLRPGADIQEGARIGNFVEVKKSTVEPGAKINHLAYIGDARVGAGANVGAGTITCNYDGYIKSRTDIGAGAFIGSNSALVAPVTIGAGAIVGAGSTITTDVAPDALAIGRGRQAQRDGWASHFRRQRATQKASQTAKKETDV
jgi:bifunctional UDP-N-acetylglucosamine pyrophosphorylase / glucosamine-1-phosphate N-acetyltransferase